MPYSDERAGMGEGPQRVPPATYGRRARQASLSSALASVAIVGVLLVAASVRQPVASDPPAGAAGVTQAPGPTEPLESWVAVTATSWPTGTGKASAAATSSPMPSALSTPWRTSPPSTCNPYVKPCDPTVPPAYDYVRVLITANGSTDATIGIGKVTFVAAGHTYTCSTYSRSADCYWDIPPGTKVVATAYRQEGSVCTYFHLMWEDHSSVTHHDCSSITFTTRTQMAQLTANFDLAATAPPPTPTNPPPPAPTDPPATPTAAPTPATTPDGTPAAS